MIHLIKIRFQPWHNIEKFEKNLGVGLTIRLIVKMIDFSEPLFDKTWASGECDYNCLLIYLAGEAQWHTIFCSGNLLWFLNHIKNSHSKPGVRSTSSQQVWEEEEVLHALCIYANSHDCVWGHFVQENPSSVAFLPESLRVGLPSCCKVGWESLWNHSVSLPCFLTPCELCNRSSSFSLLTCSALPSHASDFNVFRSLQMNFVWNRAAACNR